LDIAKESGRPESGVGKVQQELDIRRLERIEKDLLRLEEEQLKSQRGDTAALAALETRIAQLRGRQTELEKLISMRGEESVELSMRKQELERLQRIADDMAVQLEAMDIEAQSPPRIEKVQNAVIGDDD
jgi:myosin heavy subunit